MLTRAGHERSRYSRAKQYTRLGNISRGDSAKSHVRGSCRSQVEPLEPRWYPSSIPVTFNIPPDVLSRGVYAEVSGTLTTSYTNNQSQVLASGTLVYYNSTIGDYSAATSSSVLTFQLPNTGATVNLPNVDVTGGQIVIGVGSAPPVSYSSGSISTPSATDDPNYWGLFEYAITSSGLDIDMSEVDQVGFPFTITTTPAAPVPANDGVGITQDRGDLFNLYSQYIAGEGSTASLFEESISAGAAVSDPGCPTFARRDAGASARLTHVFGRRKFR